MTQRRWRVRWVRPPIADVVLAAAVWLLDVILFSDALPRAAAGGVDQFATSLGFAGFAAAGYVTLAWRRSAPIAVFVVLLLQVIGAAAWFPGYRPTLGILVALYTVAAYRDTRVSAPALLLTFATTAPIAIGQEMVTNPKDERGRVAILFIGLIYAVLICGAWGAGRWARSSRGRLNALDRRREQEAAEAVTVERQRIARELHDIVSHSVSVMTLQAAGARAILPTDPVRADRALANIEGIGKESMGELRRLLGVLDESGTMGSGHPEHGPQRGVTDIPSMVEAMRVGGLRVSLVITGQSARLAPSVDLSVYRIVQESLTNCIKHGGRDAVVTVTLAWTTDSLNVDVIDDGGASAAEHPELSTEHGLPGLRERARAVGGRLDAGPVESGGFRVSATLPLAADDEATP